jgi:hypothetical protein
MVGILNLSSPDCARHMPGGENMLEKSECSGCKGSGIDCADECIRPEIVEYYEKVAREEYPKAEPASKFPIPIPCDDRATPSIQKTIEHVKAFFPNPPKDARELADKIFEGIALRVDQFFKAKNIQGGVMSGDDLFSPIDKYELAKSIDRYSEARLASARGQQEADK